MDDPYIEEYRQLWQSDEHWTKTKEFIQRYRNDFEEYRLLHLAQVYADTELLRKSNAACSKDTESEPVGSTRSRVTKGETTSRDSKTSSGSFHKKRSSYEIPGEDSEGSNAAQIEISSKKAKMSSTSLPPDDSVNLYSSSRSKSKRGDSCVFQGNLFSKNCLQKISNDGDCKGRQNNALLEVVTVSKDLRQEFNSVSCMVFEKKLKSSHSVMPSDNSVKTISSSADKNKTSEISTCENALCKKVICAQTRNNSSQNMVQKSGVVSSKDLIYVEEDSFGSDGISSKKTNTCDSVILPYCSDSVAQKLIVGSSQNIMQKSVEEHLNSSPDLQKCSAAAYDISVGKLSANHLTVSSVLKCQNCGFNSKYSSHKICNSGCETTQKPSQNVKQNCFYTQLSRTSDSTLKNSMGIKESKPASTEMSTNESETLPSYLSRKASYGLVTESKGCDTSKQSLSPKYPSPITCDGAADANSSPYTQKPKVVPVEISSVLEGCNSVATEISFLRQNAPPSVAQKSESMYRSLGHQQSSILSNSKNKFSAGIHKSGVVSLETTDQILHCVKLSESEKRKNSHQRRTKNTDIESVNCMADHNIHSDQLSQSSGDKTKQKLSQNVIKKPNTVNLEKSSHLKVNLGIVSTGLQVETPQNFSQTTLQRLSSSPCKKSVCQKVVHFDKVLHRSNDRAEQNSITQKPALSFQKSEHSSSQKISQITNMVKSKAEQKQNPFHNVTPKLDISLGSTCGQKLFLCGAQPELKGGTGQSYSKTVMQKSGDTSIESFSYAEVIQCEMLPKSLMNNFVDFFQFMLESLANKQDALMVLKAACAKFNVNLDYKTSTVYSCSLEIDGVLISKGEGLTAESARREARSSAVDRLTCPSTSTRGIRHNCLKKTCILRYCEVVNKDKCLHKTNDHWLTDLQKCRYCEKSSEASTVQAPVENLDDQKRTSSLQAVKQNAPIENYSPSLKNNCHGIIHSIEKFRTTKYNNLQIFHKITRELKLKVKYHVKSNNYQCFVKIEGLLISKGKGPTKKDAHQMAGKLAVDRLICLLIEIANIIYPDVAETHEHSNDKQFSEEKLIHAFHNSSADMCCLDTSRNTSTPNNKLNAMPEAVSRSNSLSESNCMSYVNSSVSITKANSQDKTSCSSLQNAVHTENSSSLKALHSDAVKNEVGEMCQNPSKSVGGEVCSGERGIQFDTVSGVLKNQAKQNSVQTTGQKSVDNLSTQEVLDNDMLPKTVKNKPEQNSIKSVKQRPVTLSCIPEMPLINAQPKSLFKDRSIQNSQQTMIRSDVMFVKTPLQAKVVQNETLSKSVRENYSNIYQFLEKTLYRMQDPLKVLEEVSLKFNLNLKCQTTNLFECFVEIDGILIGKGEGSSERSACCEADKSVVDRLLCLSNEGRSRHLNCIGNSHANNYCKIYEEKYSDPCSSDLCEKVRNCNQPSAASPVQVIPQCDIPVESVMDRTKENFLKAVKQKPAVVYIGVSSSPKSRPFDVFLSSLEHSWMHIFDIIQMSRAQDINSSEILEKISEVFNLRTEHHQLSDIYECTLEIDEVLIAKGRGLTANDAHQEAGRLIIDRLMWLSIADVQSDDSSMCEHAVGTVTERKLAHTSIPLVGKHNMFKSGGPYNHGCGDTLATGRDMVLSQNGGTYFVSSNDCKKEANECDKIIQNSSVDLGNFSDVYSLPENVKNKLISIYQFLNKANVEKLNPVLLLNDMSKKLNIKLKYDLKVLPNAKTYLTCYEFCIEMDDIKLSKAEGFTFDEAKFYAAKLGVEKLLQFSILGNPHFFTKQFENNKKGEFDKKSHSSEVAEQSHMNTNSENVTSRKSINSVHANVGTLMTSNFTSFPHRSVTNISYNQNCGVTQNLTTCENQNSSVASNFSACGISTQRNTIQQGIFYNQAMYEKTSRRSASWNIPPRFFAILDYSEVTKSDNFYVTFEKSARFNEVLFSLKYEAVETSSQPGSSEVRALIIIGGSVFSTAVGKDQTMAKEAAAEVALNILKRTTFTIKVKFDGYFIQYSSKSRSADILRNIWTGNKVEHNQLSFVAKDKSCQSQNQEDEKTIRHLYPDLERIIEAYAVLNPINYLIFSPTFFYMKEVQEEIERLTEKYKLQCDYIGKNWDQFIIVSKHSTACEFIYRLTQDQGHTCNYGLLPPTE